MEAWWCGAEAGTASNHAGGEVDTRCGVSANGLVLEEEELAYI